MYVYVHYRNDEKTEIGKDSFGMEIYLIPAFSCEIKLFSMNFICDSYGIHAFPNEA
jgi:hypothetical protein